MGLLDGGLQAIFGAALGPSYLPATLRRATKSYALDGTISTSFTHHPIRVQIDRVTEAMRSAPGYTEDDIALLVLRAGVALDLNSDDEVIAPGHGHWAISYRETDPAQVYWLARATPISTVDNPLTATINITGSLSASLSVQVQLAGGITAQGGVTGLLQVRGLLSSTILATGALSASLEVLGLPAGAVAYWNAEDALVNGAILPNRLAATPVDDNIFPYATGWQPNAGSATGVTLTDVPEAEATRVALTTVGANYALYFSDTPTAEEYGLRYQLRAPPGMGTQRLRKGWTLGLSAAFDITEDWTDIPDDFVATGVGTNRNNYVLTGDGTNTPTFEIRRRVMQAGVASEDLPAWEDLAPAALHYRRAMMWPNSVAKSGNFLDNTADRGRGVARMIGSDAGEAVHASAMTWIAAIKSTVAGSAAAISCDVDTKLATTTTTCNIGIGSAGMVQSYPVIGVGVSGTARINIVGEDGIQFLVLRLESGARCAGFHEIGYNRDTAAWAGLDIRLLRLMGVSSTFSFDGYFRGGAKYLRGLSDQETYDAIAFMRSQYRRAGDAIATFKMWVKQGDSRTAQTPPGGTTYVVQQTDPSAHSPNQFSIMQAQGGKRFDRPGSNGVTSVVDDLPQTIQLAQEANMDNRGVIVDLGPMGTNDSDYMIADAAAYYQKHVTQFAEPVREAVGEGLFLVNATEMDKGTPGWHSAKLEGFDQAMRDDLGVVWDYVVDIAASALGADGASSDPVLFYDAATAKTHPSAAGVAIESALYGEMIEASRL